MKSLRVSTRPGTVMIVVIAIAVAYWFVFGLTQRHVTTDDILSTQAAQAILEHGYARFPSGLLYSRGFTIHYMVAGAIGLFGFNAFSVMLPSLLMAVGSLWLTYIFARDVLGRPWLGVLAALILIALDIQTFYATSPRMYMTLQFFTMLAAYGSWMAYVRGRSRFVIVSFLAVGAAMMTHLEGGLLVISIPATVILFSLVTRGKLPPVLSLSQTVAGTIVVIAVALFRYAYTIPGTLSGITSRGGLNPGSVGLSLSPGSWIEHIFQLDRAAPYGLSLLLVAIVAAIASFQWRKSEANNNIIFPLLLFCISAIGIFLNTTRLSPRFWMLLLPIYILIISYGIAAIAESIRVISMRGVLQRLRPQQFVPLSVLIVGVLLNLGIVAFAENISPFELAVQGYGPPCTEFGTCDASVVEYYDQLQKVIEPEDFIVTTSSYFTIYYLGRADGYLRERQLEGGGFSTWDISTDDYYGLQLIDTRAELEGLLQEQRRVLVIVDWKVESYVSPEMREFVEDNFTEFFRRGNITTYANCLSAPCGSDVQGAGGR